MATGSLPASSTTIYQFGCNSTSSTSKPNSNSVCFSVLSLTRETRLWRKENHVLRKKNGSNTNICMVMQQHQRNESENEVKKTDGMKVSDTMIDNDHATLSRVEGRSLAWKKSERTTYLLAAVLSSLGVSSMVVFAVYYKFSWQMEGGEIPLLEMFGTFAFSIGAALGMEFWARWAHRALWHASLWHVHESHHRPRDGPFELNDVMAIINAGPAIALLAFGFLNKGLFPGLCFGAGLGITVFGMAYMFVHDGLVHRRFPVGPIAHVPYLRKVAAAHQLHHADKFRGVPYGLFLGPQELAEINGGLEELDKEIKRTTKPSKNISTN